MAPTASCHRLVKRGTDVTRGHWYRSQGQEDYIGAPKRVVLTVLPALLAIFIIWRIDNPRVERFRAQVIDAVLPQADWLMAPVTQAAKLIRDLQSYQAMYKQNQELRRELQKMKKWKEAAGQLEQENARLLDLNQLQLDPKLTRVSGIVMADSGSPFRQSVLINVGSNDGIMDGWAAMDGGTCGRISGLGEQTSRVILLTILPYPRSDPAVGAAPLSQAIPDCTSY